MTWAEYEQGLEDRLVDLHSRVHRGSYRAQASKRTWIPKLDGKQRPLGVASLEDNINHEWLMQFIEHRIADERILRPIRKWLKAGVSEDGQWSATSVGTPQGSVIWPLLANIYLHYVLDLWIKQWREQHAKGDVIVICYADDVVMGFSECIKV